VEKLERLTRALADRYRIKEEIGAGGMSTVYLAEDLKHERKVAIKVLRPELAAALGADRFLAEIRTTANLQHPHILPLHDSGEADGLLFYVMPFVEGESLRERLERERQLPVDEALRLTVDLAGALDYAHDHGVVHRDIKPANILLQSGRPLIADFGIALAAGMAAEGRLTETGLSLGTPSYMSPEQATGDQRVGAETDIYSLACVLHEMLVGEPPFVGATAQAILGKIITSEPTSARAARKTVPANVDAAIRKALEKLPADRFSTAGDFGRALADPSFRHGTTGGEPASSVATWKLTTAVATLLLAVVTVVAVAGWRRSGPETPGPARYPLAQTSEEAMLVSYGTSLALSPDGSRLVYVGPGEEDVSALWLKERDEAHARRIPGTEGAQQPFFFHDGERVGLLSLGTGNVDRRLQVVSLENGVVVTLADSGFNRNGATVGPDDAIYLQGGGERERGLFRFSPSTLEMEPVTTLAPGELGHIHPQILPGGRGLLFTIWYESFRLSDADIAVADLETGEHHILVKGAAKAFYAPTGHLVYVRPGGLLLAAPFDLKSLELTGEAVPLFGDVYGEEGQSQSFGVDMALSETGTLVYTTQRAERLEGGRLVQVFRAGGSRVLDPDWIAAFESVAFSPDGRRLAVTVGHGGPTDIWVKELDTGPHSLVTLTDGMNRRPRWARDGRSLTFITDRAGGRDLYSKRADGLGEARAVLDLDADVDEAFFSPDGTWLVYRTGTEPGQRDVFAWRVGTDPGTAIPVSALQGMDEFSPVLSPDGRYMAYVSNESGQSEVWVRPFPEVNEGRWQISTGNGTEPAWAPDGRELFYRESTGDQNLVAVAVQTDPTFSRGEATPLFSTSRYFMQDVYPAYDVAPDGQSFVMIELGDQDAGIEIVVEENFFQELKEKMGG